MERQRTEKQKMLAGEFYLAADPELTAERARARRLMRIFNSTTEEELLSRLQLLQELLGSVAQDIEIEPPFYCDYGYNIHMGSRVYMNFGCTVLDCHTVRIGNDVLCAPHVQIYTAYHPTDPALRLTRQELAAPVEIGSNVWIGGGAIICPGVSIGENTTIGAGSVVVKSIPANVVAVGNPCRIVRHLS
ncbi:MAG: sugar O-acetyltransferase [Gemmatimonadaceae bacterium]|nr:sugar O-acetyltransferase [Gloeobacterales cyanobacterium ES-bin-141]